MPDEEIDNLIRDAASQHHPPYDDTAWGKMEVLLDKHLPQKKDNKKLILFLLLFLMLGGAVFFAIKNPWKNATAIAKNTYENNQVNTTAPDFTTTPNNNTTSVAGNEAVSVTLSKQKFNPTSATNTGENVKPAIAENNKQQIVNNASNIYQQKGRFSVKIKKPAASSSDEGNMAIQKNEPVKNINNDNGNIEPGVKNVNDSAADQINSIAEKKQVFVDVTTDTANNTYPEKQKTEIVKASNTAPATDKKKTGKGFTDRFAITLSVGAEVNFVELNNTGKLKPGYGVGLNYAVGKHFTLSSGLYISKKVYSALPYQYKFAGGNNYPNLVKINADCNVYEIPLSFYYNFKQVKKHSWFSGMGISSYLMKKETYNYRYKTPTGQTWNYFKTVSNQNKHYFSVLTISGGYQYKLNNRFSFFAEPYVKIPLSGVGLGKVKLNSTGILFTTAVKPFAKRK